MEVIKNLDNVITIAVVVFMVILAIAKTVIRIVTRVQDAKKAAADLDAKLNLAEILQPIIFGLVSDAERELGDGTGRLKFSRVAEWVYANIPDTLKTLFSAQEIESMIEDVLADAKQYWDENKKAKEYLQTGTEPVTNIIIEAPQEAADGANAAGIKEPTPSPADQQSEQEEPKKAPADGAEVTAE